MILSIILVHYRAKKVLYDCIRSILKSTPKITYEIIVVDNDDVKTIGPSIRKTFPKVKYVIASGNLGYGEGNNLGVETALGEYVYILNPDTVVRSGSIDKLVNFLKIDKKVGIVSPTLYDEKDNVYPLQGTSELTPMRGIFALSFLNKLFPNNAISQKYWLRNIDRTKPFEVDVVPGSALLLKKALFNKIGGFDKNFFLYFEETDFCKRAKKLGLKLFILPDAKITHYWAVSTPPSKRISKIFARSRFYYFKKNFGILNALLVEFFARVNKWNLALFTVLILGTFLRSYKIQDNLIFNGEIGYDYTTIRNFVESSTIPLIGPRTSHEWFFIGPIFYWIFAILLPLFNYSVLTGAYFFAVVGILSIYTTYYYITKLFGKKTGLISSFLLSFSPLWVTLARDARYNALTAILFVPFYYYLVKSIGNKGKSLFTVGLLMGIMFSFFPSPILLLPGALVVLFVYRKLILRKYLVHGLLGIIIPNVTYIYYNITHNFEILTNLVSWIPYRILGFVGLYPKNTVTGSVLRDNLTGLYTFFQASYFSSSNVFGIILFLIGLIYLFINFKKSRGIKILTILFAVSYIGLFLHGSPPQHYYLVIFPVPLIVLSLILNDLSKKYLWLTILIFGILLSYNFKYYFSDKWFYINSHKVSTDMYYVPYSLQLRVAQFITNDSNGKEFALSRVGPNDEFRADFSLNYQYLLKIKGAKLNNEAKLRYTIYEDTKQIPEGQKIHWEENLAIVKNENK